MIDEIRATPWKICGQPGAMDLRDNDIVAYRILQRKTFSGMLQVHQWRKPDGSEPFDNPHWIRSPSHDFARNMQPIEPPSDLPDKIQEPTR
jgi:hypothetical protein